MKTAKHTPGPWELSDCGEHIIGQADQDEIHEVADLSNTLNHEANARLIAAAPVCLSALELVLNNNRVMNALDVETRRAIMDAVTKATGGAE